MDFVQLATALLKNWKDKGEKESELPNAGVLQTALEHLQKIGTFKFDAGLDEAGAIKLATDAIKSFQRLDRRPFINGILKSDLAIRLLSAPLCPDRKDHDTSNVKALSGGTPDVGLYSICYQIDSSVDQAIKNRNTADLIADAWIAWSRLCKFLIVDEFRPGGSQRIAGDGSSPVSRKPNVTIKMDRIDGDGGILGRAPCAGPGNFKDLVVILDKFESWHPDLFQAAACHEFGHILGLDHSSSSDQLMSPIIRHGVVLPLDEDIQRIQALYQPSGIRPPRTGGRFG